MKKDSKQKKLCFFSDSQFKRLDLFLKSKSELINFSRNSIISFIKNGFVSINDKIIKKPSSIIGSNDKIEVIINKDQSSLSDGIESFDYELDILFENENIIIINKPRGLTVHPGAGNKNRTIVNILKGIGIDKFSNIRGLERIGIVHRLDKDTSGLMIIAKNNNSHYLISEMIKKKEVERKYLCLCYNSPFIKTGRIENKIIRDSKNITRMKIDDHNERSKIAITNYDVIKTYFDKKFSLIECKLETGRTHQIRLHMMSIDCPIVGDPIYKTKNFHSMSLVDTLFKNFILEKKNQMLHAFSIKFKEPITGEDIELRSMPEDFNFDLINQFSD